MNESVIISSDTLRADRQPPGQSLLHDLPRTFIGEIPPFDPKRWDITLFPVPLVDAPQAIGWEEFDSLPKVKVLADLHGVSRWSVLNNLWEGVATRELIQRVKLSSDVKFVMVHAEYGFSANIPLDDFLAEDALLATKRNGRVLPPEQGFPVRLVVPKLYSNKSVLWVRGLEFMTEDRPGFYESWENGGLAMRGDPWTQERQRATPSPKPR